MDRIRVRVQPFADRKALQLQWVDEMGRRRTRSARTADPDEAERARADLEYELNHGLHRRDTRISWEAFRDLLDREYLPARRPATQDAYHDMLDCLEACAKPATLASVTTRAVSSWTAAMRVDRGHAPATIKLRLNLLRAALTWARGQGLLAELPHFPAVSMPKKRPAPVPQELFDRLLVRIDRAGDVQLRAFALCGWLAGLRRCEAYYLEWEETRAACWVDLAANRIRFPAEVVKAREDQWVPLAAGLRAALVSLPRVEDDPRVFHFTSDPPGVVGRLTTLAKKAGVKLTMRTLRRGFGCRYAGKVPAQVLQRLMRHSSITITMQFYANIDAAIEEAVHGCNTSCNSPSGEEAASGEKSQKIS